MTQLSDLSDDCLMEVLERVSPGQLLKMQRLNQRMKRLAGIKMGVKIKAIQISKLMWCTDFYSRFASCSHLDSISHDQVLILEPTDINSFTVNSDSPTPIISSFLFKCAGVKSVDFGLCLFRHQEVLSEVFRRCPELECVKLQQFLIKQDEWDRLLDQFGQRIVHLAITWLINDKLYVESFMMSDYCLASVAAKCPNIKRVDWVLGNSIIRSDLMAAFKLLPKSCWIRLVCSELAGSAFEDDIDELDCCTLNWPQLGHRYDRLSKLKFNRVQGPVHGVEFAGLKRLDFNENYQISSQTIDHLLVCRFPLLEEFCFNAFGGFTEDDYEGMFQQMATINKLIINCGQKELRMFHYPKLPRLAVIHRLKNLETIDLIIKNIDNYFCHQPNDFLKSVEEYVDAIGSLKKLTVDIRLPKISVWHAAVEQLVKRLTLKQNRVAIILISKSSC